MTDPTPRDLEELRQWDTPTICNALEIVMPERRGYGFTVEPFVCLDPGLPAVAGYARTVKIRAACPPLQKDCKGALGRLPYYEYVASAPGPTIIVVEDLDTKPGVGAFWGEVQTNVHKGLGALGGITNGSFRDVPDCAEGFQLLGGSVGPSYAFVRHVDFKVPVKVHGMEVAHNDIIHADRHGAVVMPREAVARIPCRRGSGFEARGGDPRGRAFERVPRGPARGAVAQITGSSLKSSNLTLPAAARILARCRAAAFRRGLKRGFPEPSRRRGAEISLGGERP